MINDFKPGTRVTIGDGRHTGEWVINSAYLNATAARETYLSVSPAKGNTKWVAILRRDRLEYMTIDAKFAKPVRRRIPVAPENRIKLDALLMWQCRLCGATGRPNDDLPFPQRRARSYERAALHVSQCDKQINARITKSAQEWGNEVFSHAAINGKNSDV